MTKNFKNHRECSNFRMEIDPLTDKGMMGTCRFNSWCNKKHHLQKQDDNALLCPDFNEGPCIIKNTKDNTYHDQKIFPDYWNIDRFKKQ